MKVLLADKLAPVATSALEDGGFQVVSEPSLKDESLQKALEEHSPEVLIVRSTKVRAEHLDASPTLSLIIRAGAGTNTIDVATASQRGIYVANCPGKNAAAVAELAFGLILSADRQIPNATRDLREGVWNKKQYTGGQGLKGKTLGLVGLGNTGREMVTRARAFGMEVIAWSRSLTPSIARKLHITYAENPTTVAQNADIVSVHVALCDDTRSLVNASFVNAMKPGAIFVNTSRGGVVDEAALLHGVQNKNIRCGLDVFQNEPSSSPAPFDNPLAREPMVFGTHHIGASTQEAQEAVAIRAAEIACTWKQNGCVPSCINLSAQSAATHLLVVRHQDKVGVLAGVLDELRSAQVNVQEMENILFDGGRAAIARIRTVGTPNGEILQRLRNNPDILAIQVLPL